MSPLLVRRYRAERLLREQFEGLRVTVLASVSGRLRARGVHLDRGDLDACYAQAWQGLYAAVLDGAQIDSAAAWLTLVTHRRAIDEHRARRAIGWASLRELGGAQAGELVMPVDHACDERDLAATLDDRVRLRELFEALRGRLNEREQQAATLCYLQGLSRAEAAVRMNVSESRMRKLMDGKGASSPGVAGKLGAFVQTIGAGRWCEEQGSLMRGFAYGILDPEGDRYRLALMHRDGCPACRAYVLSLRGLAAVLPPVPALLHWALGAGAVGGVGVGAAAGTGAGMGAGPGGAGGALGPGLGGGALSASGAAGLGAAGSSWWLAGGPLGAKLAVGCLLALGVGAGCVALDGHPDRARAPRHRAHTRQTRAGSAGANQVAVAAASLASSGARATTAQRPAHGGVTDSQIPAGASRASREFGPEQAAVGARPGLVRSARQSAHVASAATGTRSSSAGGQSSSYAGGVAKAPTPGTSVAAAAEREFAPG